MVSNENGVENLSAPRYDKSLLLSPVTPIGRPRDRWPSSLLAVNNKGNVFYDGKIWTFLIRWQYIECPGVPSGVSGMEYMHRRQDRNSQMVRWGAERNGYNIELRSLRDVPINFLSNGLPCGASRCAVGNWRDLVGGNYGQSWPKWVFVLSFRWSLLVLTWFPTTH